MRVLIVIRSSSDKAALTRLARMADVSSQELGELFDFISVSESNGKADLLRVHDRINDISPARVVTVGWEATNVVRVGVLCRRSSCRSEHHNHPPWMRWKTYTTRAHTCWIASSPHPGDSNVYWRSPDAKAMGEYFWRDLVDRIEHG